MSRSESWRVLRLLGRSRELRLRERCAIRDIPKTFRERRRRHSAGPCPVQIYQLLPEPYYLIIVFKTFFPVILIRVNERIFNLPASHGELCFGSGELWVTSQSAANLPLLSERTCSSKTTSVRIRAHNKHANHIGKIVLNSCSFLPVFEGSEVILTSS